MRILILNQYFHPDIAATAQLATDLAVDLTRRGHDVTAVAGTAPYADGERLTVREIYRGVRIVRIPTIGFGRNARLLRAMDYVTFAAGALFAIIREIRPDVIIALSTPPFVGILGVVARGLRGTRLVLWVMDVYPEIAVRLGVMRGAGMTARLLTAVSRELLKRADVVVALDDAMAEHLIGAGADASRVDVIDNWCDGDAIQPTPLENNPLRRQLGLADRFTISYSGNMGLAHDFDTIVEAMSLLRHDPVEWLFIGDGPRRASIEGMSGQRQLRNVRFLPYRKREELGVSLTAAHASLVSLRMEAAGLVAPSKVYGLLAAGVPILYVGPARGRVPELIAQSRLGIAVQNGDAVGLSNAIRGLMRNPARLDGMRRCARSEFDARFARHVALERHHAAIMKASSGAPAMSLR